MKKIVILLLTTVFVASMLVTPVLAADPIRIFVDGNEVTMDVPPIIVNDRTLVPVRAISEMVGCDVEWVGAERKVIVYTPTEHDPLIIMIIDDPAVTVNWYDYGSGDFGGRSVTIDVAPMIINDRTMVPLRFIAETLGMDVQWDNGTIYMNHADGEDVNSAIVAEFEAQMVLLAQESVAYSEKFGSPIAEEYEFETNPEIDATQYRVVQYNSEGGMNILYYFYADFSADTIFRVEPDGTVSTFTRNFG